MWLTRSFDQRSHSYLGTVLRIQGTHPELRDGPSTVGGTCGSGGPRPAGARGPDFLPRQEVAELAQRAPERLLIGAGASGTVYRIDQATNTYTTVTPNSGNANAIAFDRWSGTGEIVVGAAVTNRIDITGQTITTHAGVTRTGACFYAERNLVSRRTAPNVYALDVHVPGQAGRFFALGLSASGFRPGIPVDTRVIQLTPDTVFFGSLRGVLTAFLKGNIGTLSAAARASATLDLSSLGKLTGLRLWAAAVTLDAASPSGIGVVTRPIVLVFE
ncbi:MAG: hypothetical protein JXQ29_04610 [Planctomycetes bacterium]|nr:hypothetical protein [Planctomycetota bacterium]